MCQCALVVHAIRHRKVLRVVGNGDVLQPPRDRRLCHLPNRVAPVGFGRMHMQIAAQIAAHNQLWQSVFRSCIQFAAVLPQLRRNVIEIERVINILLCRRSNDDIIFKPQQRVFAQRQAAFNCALPQRNVMHLRPGKILQRRSITRPREQSHIDLKVVAKREADLVLSLRQELVDQRKRRNVVHRCSNHFGLASRSSHQQIQVADTLSPPSQRPGRRDRIDARKLADQLADALRMLSCHVDAKPR